MTVRVVTDSSADLDRAVADEHAIEVVPLKVRFGEEEFTDGVDLSPAEFWKRLRATDILPHTTSPSPGDFGQAFSRLDAEGASGIVCVTLSSKVSATHQSARLAAKQFDGRCRVTVVDSSRSQRARNCLRSAAAGPAEASEDLGDGRRRDRDDSGIPSPTTSSRSTRVSATRRQKDRCHRRAFLGSALSIPPSSASAGVRSGRREKSRPDSVRSSGSSNASPRTAQ